MDAITLEAQPRPLGKGKAQAVRRDGEVPCVLYGPHQEPVHFRVPVLSLRPLIYTAESHRVSLELDGETYDCIVKEIAFHPVTDVPAHVDFYALTAGEEFTLTVPIALVGIPEGVKAGGILSQPLNELEIRCLPKDIPGHVEVDVSEMQVGDALHVDAIAVENVTILTDPARTVATVSAPTVEAEPEEDEVDGLLLEGEEIAGEGEGTEEAGGEPRPEGDSAEG